MKTVTAYIRVSTTDQASEGASLEAQEARCRAWAAANGHDLVNVFTDAGLSGGSTRGRDGLRDALAAAGKARGPLVVYSLSRLARSTRDALEIAERLDRAGADLVSLTEAIDTTSAAGKMVFRMLAVLAEFERDLVSERTVAALAHKSAKGERVGTAPFGFCVAADGIHLERDPAEQRALAIMGELRAAGHSLAAVAAELDSQGFRTRSGGRWHRQGVHRILATAEAA